MSENEIVGACLSQFHDEPNIYELLISFGDGKEIGFYVSRENARSISGVFLDEFAFDATKDE